MSREKPLDTSTDERSNMEAFTNVTRRAAAGPPDTSKRTKRLDSLRAEHREKVATVRADEDLTPDARQRRAQDLDQEFRVAASEESGRIMRELDQEIEAAYRRAHAPKKPSSDPQAEVAKELRLQRIRAEVYEDLSSGHDALIDYQEALRLGDTERAAALAKAGPGFLTDPTRKRRLRELVEENLPEERKEAKRDLERLEGEKRHLGLAFSLGRARRLGA